MSDRHRAEELKIGIIISARSDSRLLRATLQSIEQLADSPGMVIVVLPQGREHLLDRREIANSQFPVRILVANGTVDSWLTLGFGSLVPLVDIAVFASEGVLFDRDFVQRSRCRYADWEDLVGMIEIVADVIKVEPSGGSAGLAVHSRTRDALFHPFLRRLLRARSLMPSVLTLRTAACGQLKFVTFSAFCDWMSYALFLNRLRPRGRTVVAIAESARERRFHAERRSGFESGYELYNRLSRIRDYVDELPRKSYLNPNIEKMRLFAEQALQYLLSPRAKRHIVTVMKGMLAARRDIRMQARRIRAEIRDLEVEM
jgi:hypothetical protein